MTIAMCSKQGTFKDDWVNCLQKNYTILYVYDVTGITAKL